MSKTTLNYGPWALVTGASSGIGKAMAYLLAKQGMNTVLVARRETTLNQVAQELENRHKISTRVIACDLTEKDAIAKLYNDVSDLDIGLVIPSAGTDEMGQFLEKNYSDIDKMLALNIQTPTEIAHVFGKKLARRKKSGLILVSSLFAYQGIPNFAAYAASKSYILTLGEALNVELSKQGIDVLVLSPGLTDTPFSQSMAINSNQLPMYAEQPEKVARTALASLGRKATVVSGLLNKFYAWENRLIPRSWPVHLFGFLIDRAIASYQRNNSTKMTNQQERL